MPVAASWTYAGVDFRVWENSRRTLLRDTQITVALPGTETPATLWTDHTKSAQAANPFTTDAVGNGRFYADPGEYDCLVSDGEAVERIRITVEQYPAETDTDFVHLTGDETVAGDKTFTGRVVAAVLHAVTGLFKTRPWTDPAHPDFGGDSTGVADSTAAFQAAHDSLPASGGQIRLDGLWSITGRVAITKPVKVISRSGAVILDKRPVNGAEKLFDVQADNVTFKGITFDGSQAPAGTLATRLVTIFGGHASTTYKKLRVKNCRFVNLTRKGAANAGGNSSLESEYGVYVLNMKGFRLVDNELSEVSGAGFFVTRSTNGRIRDNDVAMLSTGDCLYPIHLDESCERVWIEHNVVIGGRRSSGGAIDVMSINGPNKAIYVRSNIIDASEGFGSGNAAIRFLSVDTGEVVDNTVRNITTDTHVHILVNYRDVPVAQPGPKNVNVRGNILVAGGTNQRAIDVRNDHPTGVGGENVDVRHNICASDGVNFFAAGVRLRDIKSGVVADNTVVYKWSAGLSASWGIDVSGTVGTLTRPVVEGNTVDCRSSASSRAIMVQGSVSKPIVRRNRLFDWGQFGLRLEGTVGNPTIEDNQFDGPDTTSAISNFATGVTARSGNRLSLTATPSVVLTDTGTIEWSSGAAAADTNLYRSAADTLKTDDKFHVVGELELDGALNHDGTTAGFFNVGPVNRPAATDDIKDALTALGLFQGTSASPLNLDGGKVTAGDAEIDGVLDHDGASVGFFGVTPVARPPATAEIKGALASMGLLTDSGASPLDLDGGDLTAGDVIANTAGKGLRVKEGTNARMGTAVLGTGGTVTVDTTAITANSRVYLTIQTPGGTVGAPYVSARSPGTSFTITSTNTLDTSTVAWMIVEPA